MDDDSCSNQIRIDFNDETQFVIYLVSYKTYTQSRLVTGKLEKCALKQTTASTAIANTISLFPLKFDVGVFTSAVFVTFSTYYRNVLKYEKRLVLE